MNESHGLTPGYDLSGRERQRKGTPMKKENQRTMLTKKLLKDSLVTLLEQESIHKISIRALCERAGINRSTFYKYYGNQYELLKDMENELLTHIWGDTLADMSTNPEMTVEQITALLTYFESCYQLVRLLVNNNVDPDFPEKVLNLPEIRALATQNLGNGYTTAQLNYLSVFLINGSFHMIREWINKENRESPRDLAMLLHGMIARICGQASL